VPGNINQSSQMERITAGCWADDEAHCKSLYRGLDDLKSQGEATSAKPDCRCGLTIVLCCDAVYGVFPSGKRLRGRNDHQRS
jgi:hypothetical protein